MTPTEILTKFCADEDDIRFYLRAPFSQGNYVYATDGKICIRFPKQEGIDAPPSDKPENVGGLFDKWRNENFLPQFPELPPANKCGACNGSGIGYKCPECDGEGEFKHGRHTYECQECDGRGDVDDGVEDDKRPCWNCGGLGLKGTPLKVGNFQSFDIRLLAKLKDLPGIRFAPLLKPKDGDAAYFTFDGGGEGLIMPMSV